MLQDERPRTWRRFLECCPSPPPPFVVDACAARVSSDPREPQETEDLVVGLAGAPITEAFRQWARRDPVAAKALRPRFAQQGDLDAQRELVRELRQQVMDGSHPMRDELRWTASLRASEFLEPLFDVLRIAYTAPRSKEPVAFAYRDAVTPALDAIASIGGREAVRQYDQLLAIGGTVSWLRPHRDRIANDVLRGHGGAAAARAAKAAGVPILTIS